MDIKIIEKNTLPIAVVQSDQVLITDVQSALDLIAAVSYDTGSNCMILNKASVAEDFFKLSTRLAGDILQKFINYQMKLAIVGDYSHYTSKPLKDFIYESNSGKHIFFVFSMDEALEKLASPR